MKILDWIQANRPGTMERLFDRIELAHASGEHSTLWLNKNTQCPDHLKILSEIYDTYDGIDLFSSTFKIASIREPKKKNNVEIVFNLDQIKMESRSLKLNFPKPSTPFMYQQGIGFYFASIDGKCIYEWDTETEELTTYSDLFDILNEWKTAIDG